MDSDSFYSGSRISAATLLGGTKGGRKMKYGHRVGRTGTTAVLFLAMSSFVLPSDLFAVCPEPSFLPATNYTTNDGASGVALADLDDDGNLDVVVANYGPGNVVSVLIGIGDGTFAAATNFAVGTFPISVAVGDLNSDSKLDLAVANFNSSDVSILLGDGTGGFGTPTNFTVGSLPHSIALGDLNADGNLDFATANDGSNDVSVRLGNGLGTFGAPVSLGVGTTPVSVALAHLNGDGKLDLAVANYGSGTASVLLGDGSGGFAPRTDYPTGTLARWVTVGDVNGDGKPDLAVPNEGFGVNTVSILLGDGTGLFGAATNFASGDRPTSVAMQDLDGDGKVDLAVTNHEPNTVSILRGNGDGSFGPPTPFGVGQFPRSVRVGDFNGDGAPDLAVANVTSGNVSILLNGCSFPTPTPTAGCPQVPATGCRSAQKSSLLLKNSGDNTKDKLVWKWLKGAETSLQDLSVPTGTTNYTLCVYAGTSAASVAIPAGSNWQPAGTKGFKYKDSSSMPDGAQKAVLKSGAAGKAKALVKGKGTNLPDTLVPMLPLPVTAQLVNDSNDVCFEAVYDSGDVKKNDDKQFKAKAQ